MPSADNGFQLGPLGHVENFTADAMDNLDWDREEVGIILDIDEQLDEVERISTEAEVRAAIHEARIKLRRWWRGNLREDVRHNRQIQGGRKAARAIVGAVR